MGKQRDDASTATTSNAGPPTRSRRRALGRNRSAIAASLLALATLACATRPGSGPRPPLEEPPEAPWGSAVVDLQYYELRKMTQAELREEIRGVRAARGMRNYGDTQWQIRTDYDFATAGGACRPTRVDVSLDLRITLPRLRDPKALSPELQAEWRRFVRALREHQAQHKQIAVDCAEQVWSALSGVGSMRCEELGDVMQRLSDEVTGSCHIRNAEYDIRTGHGASEGVSF